VRLNRLDWQALAGAVAAWALGLLAVTGLVLYGVPWADDAEFAGWRVLGMDAEQWSDLHRVAGGLLLAAAAAGLVFGGLQVTRRRSTHLLAAAIVLMLATTTLLRMPPASWLLTDEAETETAEAGSAAEDLPYPAAAQEPLAQVARYLGMDETRVAIALQEAGLKFAGLDESLAAIAEANGTTAGAVYDAIRHLEPDAPVAAPQAEATLDLIEARFAGRDIRTRSIAQLADEASIPLETALRRLRAAGLEAESWTTAGTLAARHGLEPLDVVVLLAVEVPLPPAGQR
jgi:hypothetical protein